MRAYSKEACWKGSVVATIRGFFNSNISSINYKRNLKVLQHTFTNNHSTCFENNSKGLAYSHKLKIKIKLCKRQQSNCNR